MSRCMQCKIEVLDEGKICPLCHCVLEQENDGAQHKNMYPNVKQKVDMFHLIMRIYAFLAIVAESILILINYMNFNHIWWSIITGGALLYGFLTLRFTIFDDAGYKIKTVLQTLFAVAFVVMLDYTLGYTGWSMNYAIPIAIMAVDIGLVVLMVVNYRNWQSYMLFQIFMIICSAAPMILYGVHIVTNPLLGFIAIGFSLLVFLGTYIVGGSRARRELKRRFHI